ncbi:MAG: sulfatase-like hydrolase/transferase [Planctomycetota bacterium]
MNAIPSRRAIVLVALLSLTLGCSQEPDQPSVLLVTIDTLRADRLGCYGYEGADTPNLDALAERGVQFLSAMSQSQTTLPSHTTILTGALPPYHGVRANGLYVLEPDVETLAERFRAKGYRTGAIVASVVLDKSYGLDQGFESYDDAIVDPTRKHQPGERMESQFERRGDEITRLAKQWIDEHDGEPWFLWVHYYDPHFPYAAPGELGEAFKSRPYDGEVAYADRQVGELIDHAGDEALVVVTSDHGEGLGDHEETHRLFIYEPLIHVPLLIAGPGVEAVGRTAGVVSSIDIAPTLLDHCDVPPGGLVSQGRSLEPVLRGEDLPAGDPAYAENVHVFHTYGWSPLYGLRDVRYKFIEAPEPELYDLQQDPGESNNLAAAEPDRLSAYRERLQELMQKTQRRLSNSRELSAEDRARLASLGYVHAVPTGEAEEVLADPKDMARFVPLIRKIPMFIRTRNAPAMRQAVPQLEEFLSLNPKNAVGHERLGQVLAALDRPEEADEHFQSAIDLTPDFFRPYQSWGEVLLERGEEDRARELLEKATELAPLIEDSQQLLNSLEDN